MGDAERVFVVEDDTTTRTIIEQIVSREGFEAHSFPNAMSMRAALKDRAPDIVCLDLGLPDEDGLGLLRYLEQVLPGRPVIVITASDDVGVAVDAMKHGAFDYIEKPPQPMRLRSALHAASKHATLASKYRRLEWDREKHFGGIISQSEAMERLISQLGRLASCDVSTFIHGETGTGKELVARAIHDHSGRREAPFVAVNCAAISSSLQQSELFGHEKGAFTGASTRRIGYFEEADGGTLFLDEVAELHAETQATMLRVLQERQLRRVGGSEVIESDFRLLTASHKNLREEVEAGRFREDLMFRINVFDVRVPPLRERPGDLSLLVDHFLSEVNDNRQLSLGVSERAMRVLESYDWPGNVRELKNAVERASVVADELIEPEDLPQDIRSSTGSPAASEPSKSETDGRIKTLAELEKEGIERALDVLGDNPTAIADALGIARATLYRKFKEYDIDRDSAE
jgi:DNA-binding NtrC family response regulator